MITEKLLSVHFLFRPQIMNYFYLYGAKIHFAGEDLFYQNSLLSPGRALVSWSEHELTGMPTVVLPNLLGGIDYQFEIVSEEKPKGSIALALTTFKDNGEQFDYQIFPHKKENFSLEVEEKKYSLDLVSLGNQYLHFKHILLAAKPVLQDYDFTVRDAADVRTILIQYRPPASHPGKLHVYVRNCNLTITTVSFMPKQDSLFIFIPVHDNGQGKFTQPQLFALAKLLNEFRQNQRILQIENNQLTCELIKTLQLYIKND